MTCVDIGSCIPSPRVLEIDTFVYGRAVTMDLIDVTLDADVMPIYPAPPCGPHRVVATPYHTHVLRADLRYERTFG